MVQVVLTTSLKPAAIPEDAKRRSQEVENAQMMRTHSKRSSKCGVAIHQRSTPGYIFWDLPDELDLVISCEEVLEVEPRARCD